MSRVAVRLSPDNPEDVTFLSDFLAEHHRLLMMRVKEAIREAAAEALSGEPIATSQNAPSPWALSVTALLGGIQPVGPVGLLAAGAVAMMSGRARREQEAARALDRQVRERQEQFCRKLVDKVEEKSDNQTIDQSNAIDFMAAWNKKYNNKSEIDVPEDIGRVSQKFAEYLQRSGFDQETIDAVTVAHDRFVRDELPDMDVLEAVQTLRKQYEAQRIEPKRPFEGIRQENATSTAREYLELHYGDEIEAGLLTPGRLKALDERLYNAVRQEISRDGLSLTDILQSSQEETYNRRREACSRLLGGASLRDTESFFRGVRDRTNEPSRA